MSRISDTKYVRRTRAVMQLAIGAARALGKPKVFCIGYNKTGTTSMAKAFSELGLVVGIQWVAERLLRDWARRDFRRIFLYCYTAQAFQDTPFSLPFTFQALDQRFPGSKFILTLRDSAAWYKSQTRYDAALYGRGCIPTLDDLRAAKYHYPGHPYEIHTLIYNIPADDPYNREILIGDYNAHNYAVQKYFRHRPEDLLTLDVAEPGAYDRLCQFLGKPPQGRKLPWENRTADIEKARQRSSSQDILRDCL